MTHDKELYEELKPTRVESVLIVHCGRIKAKEMGTIAVETQACTKTITNVLYLPDLD